MNIEEMLELGWVVFPLAYGTKQPPEGTSGHLSWSQADSRDYLEELTSGKFNVGIVSGKSSGIIVIDIDPRNGGHERSLEEILGEPVNTRVHRTRSGGWHYFFKYPEGVEHLKKSTSKLGPGVDVQADGCYVVGPGSYVDEKGLAGYYTVESDVPMQPLPAKILNLALPVERDVPDSHYQYPADQWEDVVRWHRMNVREAANADEGTRDNTAYSMLVRSFQLTHCVPDDILSKDKVIQDFASKLPYTLKGFSGKIERAYAYAELTPRPHPSVFVTPHTVTAHAPSEIDGPPVITMDDYAPNALMNPAQFNDAGNADRLVELYGDRVRYVEGVGWLIWDGKVWRPESESSASVMEMISTAHAFFWEDYNEKIKAEEQGAKALYAHAQYSLSYKGITFAMNLLKSRHQIRINVEDLDSHKNLLCVRNGVVDLRTGMLHPHDPNLHMTRIIDIDYHIDADANRWNRFLDEVMPDMPEMPGFLQRLVGYGITGETSEHCLAIHYGRGSNGKSIFLDTLRGLFGPISTVTDWSSFEQKKNGAGGPRPDLVRLRGARLVTVNEADARASIDEAQIKRMASGDMITARGLNKDDIEFYPNFLLQMATNAKPDIRGADEGIWRRVKLIPWTRFFAEHEQDHTLIETLKREAEGILAWAVRGAVEWYATGLQEPERVRGATRDYREAADILGGFIDEVAHGGWLAREENKKVPSAWAYSLYKKWALTQSYTERDMLSQKKFKAALEERGFNAKRTSTGTVFLGLAANNSIPAVRSHTVEGGGKPDIANGQDEAVVREMF